MKLAEERKESLSVRLNYHMTIVIDKLDCHESLLIETITSFYSLEIEWSTHILPIGSPFEFPIRSESERKSIENITTMTGDIVILNGEIIKMNRKKEEISYQI